MHSLSSLHTCVPHRPLLAWDVWPRREGRGAASRTGLCTSGSSSAAPWSSLCRPARWAGATPDLVHCGQLGFPFLPQVADVRIHEHVGPWEADVGSRPHLCCLPTLLSLTLEECVQVTGQIKLFPNFPASQHPDNRLWVEPRCCVCQHWVRGGDRWEQTVVVVRSTEARLVWNSQPVRTLGSVLGPALGRRGPV